MTISSRIESISRDVALLIAEDLSPEAQSAALAQFAAGEIAEAERANRGVVGSGLAGKQVFVDGREGAPLASVQPNGVIVAEFNLLGDMIEWIGAQLVLNSPRRSGKYASSHVMFVDGVQQQLGSAVADASEVAFVNLQPYARKIERGLSSQAPDGVYQAIASVAARRFGNVARVYFDYRTLVAGSKAKNNRQPAIVVRIG